MNASERASGSSPRRARRVTLNALVATAVGALAVLLAPASPASAAPLACGTVITTDTTLQANMTCSGDALYIGADAITLDLGGYRITGDGTGSGISNPPPLDGPHVTTDVTIRNGTVAGFARDVFVERAENLTVDGVHLIGTGEDGYAVKAYSAMHSRLIRSEVSDGAMIISGTSGFDVSASVLRRVRLGSSEYEHLQITGNTLVDSSIHIAEMNYLVIADNRLVRTPTTVILSDWVTIRDNWINGVDTGIEIGDLRGYSTISGNVVTNSAVGLLMYHARGLTVEHNSFLNNGAAGAVQRQDPGTCTPSAYTDCVMTIRDNTFVGNGYRPGDRAPLADGLNVAGDPGTSILVAGNHAVRNARYGIYAAPDTVVDGGGNVSVGDGAGCLGVLCS